MIIDTEELRIKIQEREDYIIKFLKKEDALPNGYLDFGRDQYIENLKILEDIYKQDYKKLSGALNDIT